MRAGAEAEAEAGFDSVGMERESIRYPHGCS